MDSGAKIRIKVGAMEVEYEGDPSFLKDGLESLLSKMADLSIQVPPEPETAGDAQNGPTLSAPSNGVAFSTSTIAAHLDAKKINDLAVCALSKLEIVDGKASAKRTEILSEMKLATGFYTKHMSSNLAKALISLTKAKRVTHGANESYSLSADERKSIEAKIANIE